MKKWYKTQTFLGGSDAWILSGDLESLKHIGLRLKEIKLFNGPIETKLCHIHCIVEVKN